MTGREKPFVSHPRRSLLRPTKIHHLPIEEKTYQRRRLTRRSSQRGRLLANNAGTVGKALSNIWQDFGTVFTAREKLDVHWP